jgi:hypothetical protein
VKLLNKWLATPGGASEVSEVPSGTINGSNKDFIITYEPITGSLKVFIDSLIDVNFSYVSLTKTITMVDAPVVGQNIRVVYNK